MRKDRSSKRTAGNSWIERPLKSITTFFETADAWGVFIMGSTFVLMLGSAYMVYILQNDFTQFNLERKSSFLGLFFFVLGGVLFLVKAGFFLFTLYRYFKYKSIPSVSDDELPTCTVIVPAYNEGKQVWNTLQSLANSDFPKDKLQLFAIDDGSVDDTWEWIKKAKESLGDNLTIYKQPKNKGKRQALYYGFKKGNGEVFVTVDSDSEVEKQTLRNLISPFVMDNRCGAVAGNIRVLNNKKALLPKMLDVSFVLSFEFVRSAESSLNSVLCTPGALAAYKREAVFGCLEEWINQTFMGQPSDIGEDRALTNMILKQGYHVLFQKNACAYTNVPEKYRGLYKMFIRWGRSNVRENIEMSKYVFKNFRKGPKWGSRILFIDQFLEIVMSYPFLIFMLYFVFSHPLLFLSSTFVGILVMTTFPVIFYAKRYRSSESFWAYSYSILFTFGLFWITPYAIATANKRGWLTRSLPEKN